MSFQITGILGHQIWLTYKGKYRSHTVTRQFFNENVYAMAALTSLSWFDTETMAGFVQSVSDSGVETFGHKYIKTGNDDDDPMGIGAYEAGILDRKNVTSLTFELTGNGGAGAQFTFFVSNDDGSEGGDKSEEQKKKEEGEGKGSGGKGRWGKGRDVGPMGRDMLLGFDKAKGALAAVHEFIGTEKFIRVEARKWTEHHEKQHEDLIFVLADKAFKFDPDAIYRLDKAGKIAFEKHTPKSSA